MANTCNTFLKHVMILTQSIKEYLYSDVQIGVHTLLATEMQRLGNKLKRIKC